MLIDTFKFTNEATQKVATASSTRILRQYPNNDSGRQRFKRLRPTGATQLASCGYNDSSVVDAMGGDLTVPSVLQIYAAHGGQNQRWRIREERIQGSGPDGYRLFSIKADDTDMAWDIPNGSTRDGTYIQLYPFHGGDNQLWRMENKPTEAVVLKSVHNNRVLDVPNFASDLVYIHHFPENGGYNQAWTLEDVGPDEKKIRSVSSGRYLMSSVVTVDGDALVFQTTRSNSDNQVWVFSLTNGTGTIKNKGTGFFLSVLPAPHLAGDLVHCLSGAGGNDRQWTVIS
jgi:hypothetical protein